MRTCESGRLPLTASMRATLTLNLLIDSCCRPSTGPPERLARGLMDIFAAGSQARSSRPWCGVVVLVFVQEAGDLPLHGARLQQVPDRAGAVEQLLLQLGWKGVPPHDDCGSEAAKNLLLVFRERRDV